MDLMIVNDQNDQSSCPSGVMNDFCLNFVRITKYTVCAPIKSQSVSIQERFVIKSGF